MKACHLVATRVPSYSLWHPDVVDQEGEEELDGPPGGGNMNSVFRQGNTVVRDAGPWTPTVHRVLDYLHLAGIDWVPRPIEVSLDESGQHGQERLSYLDGDVPAYPLPKWVWADEILFDGAQRLRRLHDASIGFPADGAIWRSPAKVPAEVICHNDFSPHNLVFHDGQLVGAIDFDFCSPGPRLWDIAYFATRIVPLTAETPAGALGIEHARRRVELILDAYGADTSTTFEDVIRVAIIRLHDLAHLSRSKAEELDNPQLLDDADSYDRDRHFLTALRP